MARKKKSRSRRVVKSRRAPKKSRRAAVKTPARKKTKSPAKAAKARASKRRASASKASLVKRTIPNPVEGKFVVWHPSGLGCLTTTNTLDTADRAKLFDSKEAAQAAIDAELVMAAEDAPVHTVEIADADTLLCPSYAFKEDPNEPGAYLLDVTVVSFDDERTKNTFKAAHAETAKALKTASMEAAKRLDKFQTTWG